MSLFIGNAYSLQQNQTIQKSKKKKKKRILCDRCCILRLIHESKNISVVEIYCQLVEGCAKKVYSKSSVGKLEEGFGGRK